MAGRFSDFDGDAIAEMPVSSPWGLGMLNLAGGTLASPFMAANGTRFRGWLLNTADNRFSPVGDFDGDGRDGSWSRALGILKLAGNTLSVPCGPSDEAPGVSLWEQ